MKKIGIMTLHYIPNYGAVLQSYALKKVLSNFCKAEIIDYRQDNREKNNSFKSYIKWARSGKTFAKIVKMPLHFYRNRYLIKMRKELQNFYVNRLGLQDRITEEKKEELNGRYKAIVVGSDQVWNPKVLDGNYTLLLEFFNGKKYSYASSIGVKELPQLEKRKYKEYLGSFTYISCREKQGTNIVNELFGENRCITVLDPTFLLTKDEWIEESTDALGLSEYVLVYMARYDKKLFDIAKRIEDSNRVIYIATPAVKAKSSNVDIICDVKPECWLEYFRKASLIITNSFHGIAFSINLNIQFYACFDNETDANGTNSRMENILELFELNDRLISSYEEIDYSRPIDYKNVNNILYDERKKSMDYLMKIVNDIEDENEC